MLASFLFSLGGGMLLVLATGRPDQLAWRFVRMVGFIVVAAISLPLAWRIRMQGGVSIGDAFPLALAVAAALSAATLSGLAPVLAERPNLFRALCILGGIAGLGAGYLASAESATAASLVQGPAALRIAGQTLGAIFLGSITVAWLLGHAYLTATKMTLDPLRHFSRFLVWTVSLRAAFFVGSALTAWLVGSSAWTAFTGAADHSLLTWVFLTLRVAVGLIAVGVFAWMVRDCVRLRATQSATGILYFGSIFAYVGELCGQQLLALYGWPL